MTAEFFDGIESVVVQQMLVEKLINLLVESKKTPVVGLVKDQLLQVSLKYSVTCKYFVKELVGYFFTCLFVCCFQLRLSSELVVNELIRHSDQLGGDILETTPRKRARYAYSVCIHAKNLSERAVFSLMSMLFVLLLV